MMTNGEQAQKQFRELGILLKAFRKGTGKTLRQFCKAYDLDHVTMSKLERGKRGPYTDKELLPLLPVIIKARLESLDEFVETLRNA